MSDAPASPRPAASAGLRLLLVDDEPLARLRLRALIDEIGADTRERPRRDREPDPGGNGNGPPDALRATVLAEAGDADEALAALRAQTFDGVLLDIGLPGRDGLRLAAALRTLPHRPEVIFVTAHAAHALRAFELEALDYLTKPVRRERLQQALERLRARRDAPAAAPAAERTLVVSERGRVVRVPVAEVLYLRAGQKYVTLRTAGRSIVLDQALTEFQHRLGPGFIRVHRNAIVAIAAIRALEMRELGGEDAGGDGWAVRVAPVEEWVAVSRRQVAAVRQALGAAGA